MWLNLQFPVDLVSFTEEILNRKPQNVTLFSRLRCWEEFLYFLDSNKTQSVIMSQNVMKKKVDIDLPKYLINHKNQATSMLKIVFIIFRWIQIKIIQPPWARISSSNEKNWYQSAQVPHKSCQSLESANSLRLP